VVGHPAGGVPRGGSPRVLGRGGPAAVGTPTGEADASTQGPDAPECRHDTVVMGRCDTCGAYPHGHYEPLGGPVPDAEQGPASFGAEPLGGPQPGVDGSHLPDEERQPWVNPELWS